MRREFVAIVGTEEISISAEPESGERWSVTIGECSREVDATELRPGVWSILDEGRSYLVDLDQRRRGKAIIHGTVEVETVLEDARRRRLAHAVSGHRGAGQRGEEIIAPIAGKVVKLAVEAGQTVEPGHSVAVLEAMKMENEIKAERGGTVKAVHVSPGQSVETGDRLVTLA
ncbi:MAG: hypothetical protein MJE77_42525 [Proteobacteria bacterium]|nr:hypothetical protein [Pseudomonadota bacterium]